MSEAAYRVTVKYGSVESRTFYREEGNRLVCYTYAIHRDQHGLETHRTDPTPISSIGYEDGSAFTMEERDRLMRGEPRKKRGLFARLFGA